MVVVERVVGVVESGSSRSSSSSRVCILSVSILSVKSRVLVVLVAEKVQSISREYQ